MKHILFCIMACALSLLPATLHAQIGYQVSLLNTATGEPRAGVTVNATVTITDSADKIIYTGTQQATSNDFGVLSLTVGNADTFGKADFGKQPFFIAVSVDGALIGKSQILSVPVAEYAKRTGELTVEKLVGTWKYVDEYKMSTYTFHSNGTYNYTLTYSGDTSQYNGTYFIDGNNIWMQYTDDLGYNEHSHYIYIPSKNMISSSGGGCFYTKQ